MQADDIGHTNASEAILAREPFYFAATAPFPPSAVEMEQHQIQRQLEQLENRIEKLVQLIPSPPAPHPEPRPNARGPEDLLVVSGWRGWSMEEARALCKEGARKASERTPEQVLEDLQRGNARFWTGHAHRPEKSAFERRALMTQQVPLTAVLGCADSRVPVEVVFDQGLGDMFVVRVAGNLLDSSTFASLEYAALHVKVKVLLVLGHEGCGAIKAAEQSIDKINEQPPMLRAVLTSIKEGLDKDKLPVIRDDRARERESVTTNIRRQMERLSTNENIMKLVEKGELIIVGAIYEISSGIVDFIMQLDQSNAQPVGFTRQGSLTK